MRRKIKGIKERHSKQERVSVRMNDIPDVEYLSSGLGEIAQTHHMDVQPHTPIMVTQ